MADILVIGYGNQLRRDDGIGPFVADSLAGTNLPGVRVLVSMQLLPELAVDLVAARLVVFVDASMESSEIGVEVRRLTPEDATEWSTHHTNPSTLLALSRAVYGRTPEAWWVKVFGQEFDYRQGLSRAAKENARRAIDGIGALLQGHRIDAVLQAFGIVERDAEIA